MSAIRGKRGQALLRDLAAALDAMPDKSLGTSMTQCALGELGVRRGVDMAKFEPTTPEWTLPGPPPKWWDNSDDEIDHDAVGAAFDINEKLVREIMYINDEWGRGGGEARWRTVRKWVAQNLAKDAAGA